MSRDLTGAGALRPIETPYNGCRFRSRLEARWAVYFDAEGILWDYEPQGFHLASGLYLPDFWLRQVSMYAEVKPHPFGGVELARCQELADGSGFPVVLLDGPPDVRSYFVIEPSAFVAELGIDGPVHGDCYVSAYHAYVADEGRFYSCTGAGWPNPQRGAEAEFAVCRRSVELARSARFEHGERPSVPPPRDTRARAWFSPGPR